MPLCASVVFLPWCCDDVFFSRDLIWKWCFGGVCLESGRDLCFSGALFW